MMNNYKKIYLNNINQKNFPKTNDNINNNIMKYGVLWAPTINIGDDIQTLAGINFLKKHGINEYVYVNREELNKYDGEPIKLIMNGWYMHNINNFPPSDNIYPIFISIHVADKNLVKNNVKYFRKYQPIGCRDESTVKLFESFGIKAYFSGCLTLLFDDVLIKNLKNNNKYLVDLDSNVEYIDNVNYNKSNYSEFYKIKHDYSSEKEIDQLLITFIFDNNYINIFFTVAKSIILSEYSNYKSKIVFLVNYFGTSKEIRYIEYKFNKIFKYKNKIYIKNILEEYPDINNEINNCYDFKSAASQIQTASVYCRFYLDKIWDNFNGNLLYLDLDLIVRKPVSDLFASLDDKHTLFACDNMSINECIIRTSNFNIDFNQIIESDNELKKELKELNCKVGKEDYDKNELGFNAGVWAINLDNFRKYRYSDILKLCMKVQSKKKIFKHNDQGIMNLVFYKNFKIIDKRWNVYDYGHNCNYTFFVNNLFEKLNNNFEDAYIIHYSGPKKPWLKNNENYFTKGVELWDYFEKFDVDYYQSYFTSIKLNDRLNTAKRLMNKYKHAKLVITTRLHVILPCRALNTDAIFVHSKYFKDPRFDGLREIINGDTEITDKKNIERDLKLKEIRDNLLQIKI